MDPRTAEIQARGVVILFAIIALVIITLAVLAFAGAGGDRSVGPGPALTPAESEPRPVYEQIPEDLCDRLRVEDAADLVDLSIAPEYERTSNYQTRRTHSYESCWFSGWADNRRFATAIQDFQPAGPLTLRVYHKPADAATAYRQHASSDEVKDRAHREPEATSKWLGWWWHNRKVLEWVQELNPDDYDDHPLDDSGVSRIGVQYLLQYDNLVIMAHLSALAPTEDAAEALVLLHDLEGALINEALNQLTLPTG